MSNLHDPFETMSQLLNEAVVLIDKDGLVTRANDAAFELLGNNIANKPLDNFLRHPDFVAVVTKARYDGVAGQLNYTRMGQVRREFNIRVAPFGDGNVILVIADLTVVSSFERIQSEFVANVSHELRSPLTALAGFIETLQNAAQDDEEARERFLSIMQSEAERMQRLIDDLLSLSRVEAEEHRSPRDPVDLFGLLDEVMASQGNRAEQNEMQIVLDNRWSGADDLPIIAGARDELLEVFHNLVENAVKYGHRGSQIDLRVTEGYTVDRQPRDNLVRVQVVNHGDTIASEHLSRLTERFYRIDKGRSRKMGGTGLGLAIVKHIINRHRGRLRITSEDGETTFSVTLPLYSQL